MSPKHRRWRGYEHDDAALVFFQRIVPPEDKIELDTKKKRRCSFVARIRESDSLGHFDEEAVCGTFCPSSEIFIFFSASAPAA